MIGDNIFEFPPEIAEKVEAIKELRRELVAEYAKSGNFDEGIVKRIGVILRQLADVVYERFPVVFMQRRDYIIPAPPTEKEVELLRREGFELIIPPSLEGKSLSEILANQQENLLKYVPVYQMFAVDAEYLAYLAATLQAEREKGKEVFLDKKMALDGSVEPPKDEYTKEAEAQTQVSENIKKSKKSKAKDL